MFGQIAIIITLLVYVSGALSVKLGPCKKGDNECLTKTLNEVHPIIISGIPSLGIESSDPMFHRIVEADYSTLKGKLINSTVRGFKDCVLKNVKFSLETLKIHYDMDCPSISMSGDYELSGIILNMPVEGKGTYEIATGRYLIYVDAVFKKVIGSNGKTTLNFNDLNIKSDALAPRPIKVEFKNIFNGQKDLSDTVNKFIYDHWKDVTQFIQDPIVNQNIKTLNSNYNNFLNTISLEEVLIN